MGKRQIYRRVSEVPPNKKPYRLTGTHFNTLLVLLQFPRTPDCVNGDTNRHFRQNIPRLQHQLRQQLKWGRELVGGEDAVEPAHSAAIHEEWVVAAAAEEEEPALQILVGDRGELKAKFSVAAPLTAVWRRCWRRLTEKRWSALGF